MSEQILKYFPSLTPIQKEKLVMLKPVYEKWNSMINVISRKDIDNFYVHHVLHSLSIAKIVSFSPASTILDVGTGGGFPGIPLAIMFPHSNFTLLDSIEKKIKVVNAIAGELDLKNVIPVRKRVEEEKGKYHFIVCRAVTDFSKFVDMTSKNLEKGQTGPLRNGILYLKGGDLTEELKRYRTSVRIWNIIDFFDESFFETKRIVYLPV